jgi:DNA-binding MarR family transcriptional regulator
MNMLAKYPRTGAAPGDSAPLARRLVLLGNQMLKLAREISRRGADAERKDAPAGDLAGESSLLGLLAEEVYRDRRRRAQHFPHRLLGEPAWDILLDLYVAAVRGEPVSVSNACRAADAPASTALRWLQHLEDEGLVERRADPSDARRHFARLTKRGVERMNAYFEECRGDLVSELGLAPTGTGEELPAPVTGQA